LGIAVNTIHQYIGEVGGKPKPLAAEIERLIVVAADDRIAG
jgi:hypothetical protein